MNTKYDPEDFTHFKIGKGKFKGITRIVRDWEGIGDYFFSMYMLASYKKKGISTSRSYWLKVFSERLGFDKAILSQGKMTIELVKYGWIIPTKNIPKKLEEAMCVAE